MPKITPTSKQTENKDQKILEPSTYLETEKEHKKWHNQNLMGKQGDRPRIFERESKKEKGTKKHSTRKEMK